MGEVVKILLSKKENVYLYHLKHVGTGRKGVYFSKNYRKEDVFLGSAIIRPIKIIT